MLVADVDELLAKLESRRGVEGYMAVQTDLERISALKTQVDETKGEMLQRISRIVVAIKDKVTAVTPLLNDLRGVRLCVPKVVVVPCRLTCFRSAGPRSLYRSGD